ncbi:hypothetical protein CAMRE0001_0504 [Campylobacter rectus RM3267]|uniref:Uncharacterized protein n=1 Tax=Campylobacter rectus RM3267 TaxID=553218 RepID=B9D2Y1_CAMRE|nr:hypothetical protein CAMRE0001_0504 [Campylobacter rectus RM3267]
MLVFGPKFSLIYKPIGLVLRNLTKRYFFEFAAFDSVVNLKSLF